MYVAVVHLHHHGFGLVHLRLHLVAFATDSLDVGNGFAHLALRLNHHLFLLFFLTQAHIVHFLQAVFKPSHAMPPPILTIRNP